VSHITIVNTRVVLASRSAAQEVFPHEKPDGNEGDPQEKQQEEEQHKRKRHDFQDNDSGAL
jgi:hypothetical protein